MAYLYVIVLFSFESTVFDTTFTNVYVFTADEIKSLPISNLNEIMIFVPGMNKDYKTLHLRGSTHEREIAYYIDGVPVRPTEFINLNAIEEISIQKSGFSSEYGGAGGIVYIKTKKLEKNSLGVAYLTDDFLSDKRLNYGFSQVDLDGQGNIKRNLHYFLFGKSFYTDVSSPGFYRVFSPGNCYNGLVGLNYFLNGGSNLSMKGYIFRDQSSRWHPNIIGGNAYKYFSQKPMVKKRGHSIILTGDFLLGRKTASSIKYHITRIDSVFGNRDYEWEDSNGHQWYDDYRLKAEHLIGYLKNKQLPLRDVILDSLIKYHREADMRSEKSLRHNPYGISGIFYTFGDYPAWCYYNSMVQQLFLKMKHIITGQNEIKYGVDIIWSEFSYYTNPLPWFTQSLWNYCELRPGAISVYLEDRWITEHIGIFAGIRYSHVDYGLYQPLSPELYVQDTITKLKNNYVSPRIGFVLPVTRGLGIFFNGGEIYYEQAVYIGRYEPVKTRIYEMGCKLNSAYEILLTGSLYQKYMYDLYIQKVQDYGYFPRNYLYKYTYNYIDRAEVSGLEMNIEKPFGQLASIGLSYNLQFTKQVPVYGYNYYYDYYYGGYDPINGELIQYEKTSSPLDHDCRHSLKTFLILDIPKGFFALLSNSTFSLAFSLYSGMPYTPEDLTGQPLGDMNSARMPAHNNLDLKYLKKFKIGPFNLVITSLINNLFNTKQIVYVYPITGKADEHGYPEPSLNQFGWLSATSPYYSPQCDFNHDGLITPVEMREEYLGAREDYYANPLHYTNPFRLRLGLGLELY